MVFSWHLQLHSPILHTVGNEVVAGSCIFIHQVMSVNEKRLRSCYFRFPSTNWCCRVHICFLFNRPYTSTRQSTFRFLYATQNSFSPSFSSHQWPCHPNSAPPLGVPPPPREATEPSEITTRPHRDDVLHGDLGPTSAGGLRNRTHMMSHLHSLKLVRKSSIRHTSLASSMDATSCLLA